MRFYSCWFQAQPEEAAAILSVATTEERQRTDWTHLILTDVDASDVNKLERLVLPRGKGRPKVGGKLLAKTKMTAEPFVCVSQVEPTFVHGMAVLDEPGIDDLARKWQEALSDVEEGALAKLLRDMAAFARQAEQSASPVLQLDLL